jgi:hypothetical protein
MAKLTGGAGSTTRALLLAGFGGLLLLMAFAGFDAVGVLREIQTSNDRIRSEFVARNRALEQIRSVLRWMRRCGATNHSCRLRRRRRLPA